MANPFTNTEIDAMPAEELNARLYIACSLLPGCTEWWGPVCDRWRDFLRWFWDGNPPGTTGLCRNFTRSATDAEFACDTLGATYSGVTTCLINARNALKAENANTNI